MATVIGKQIAAAPITLVSMVKPIGGRKNRSNNSLNSTPESFECSTGGESTVQPPVSCVSPLGSNTSLLLSHPGSRPYQSTLRSYSKWSPTEQGATLVWRDLCVYAKDVHNGRGSSGTRESIKRIINNVSGAVTPGTLIALMGSSGAGKSTLMSALAYRTQPGTIVQGDILVNGHPIGPYMYRLSGFVHQDDLFVGSLTASEHLYFMAKLKLERGIPKKTVDRLIQELLERTGLAKCSNTRIGEVGVGKMLSGGEKKRLAFATELLTKPTILFCDEPTTGLDSFSAQNLVSMLQLLAKRGTAIICTIHQPSSQLFSMFDQVMLLADGRVAFAGKPNDALNFFEQHGYCCPSNYNPAEFLIGVLAMAPGYEKASQRSAHRLCDLFAVSEAASQRDVLINLEMHMAETGDFNVTEEKNLSRKPLWAYTVFWLTYRCFLTVVRDPTVQYLRYCPYGGIVLFRCPQLGPTGCPSHPGNPVYLRFGEHLLADVLGPVGIPGNFSSIYARNQIGTVPNASVLSGQYACYATGFGFGALSVCYRCLLACSTSADIRCLHGDGHRLHVGHERIHRLWVFLFCCI
ncbi:protein scarlet isoform X3 [Uranotaenia lowii]|uniref:protein scarlet isoform X3 n=1 Tax=Uranotaenia lowii TaxID=190385 RepID=UPI00247990B7|nr:protein scarlet isoform X3 [Uranotaenia lowii]